MTACPSWKNSSHLNQKTSKLSVQVLYSNWHQSHSSVHFSEIESIFWVDFIHSDASIELLVRCHRGVFMQRTSMVGSSQNEMNTPAIRMDSTSLTFAFNSSRLCGLKIREWGIRVLCLLTNLDFLMFINIC